jgi:signal transduction histidine kinase
MTNTALATTTLTLPDLIGVPVESSRCVLSSEQISQVCSLLLKHRPQEERSICFVGGAVSRGLGGAPPLRVIPLQHVFGDDPFIVIVGKGGSVTLLTSPARNLQGYHARLLTDPEIADQAALALTHFSDAPEMFDVRDDPVVQRAFISTLLVALVGEPVLRGIDFDELVPGERRRLAHAREQVATSASIPTASPAPIPVAPAPKPVAAGPWSPVPQQPMPIAATKPVLARSIPTDRRAPLASLLHHLDESILLVDQEGRLAGFSPSAARLLELPETAVGQPLIDGPAAFCANILTDTLLGELNGPARLTLPDGRHATVSAVTVDHGMWGLFFRLPEAPTALTAPVPVAPRNAASAIVAEAVTVERAERFMASFANGMRAPLRALRDLISQLPAAGSLNEQQSRVVGQVVKLNGEIMLLVNDLFVLGQMRMHVPESRVPLRIDLLIEAAVGTQYAEFGRRGQTVDLEIQPDLPTVPGSEEGLWRALSALIDNAIKYSPTGAQIVVRATYVAGKVQVAVQDNGPGLSAEEIEQVFDPFYRASLAEQLGVPGRGLGLTIARAVIEQHGGQIWAESHPGNGSVFTVGLPTV